jgi:hypothetical protein
MRQIDCLKTAVNSTDRYDLPTRHYTRFAQDAAIGNERMSEH